MKKAASTLVPIAPQSKRATWARQPTPYDAPECKDCGEHLSTPDAEAGFTTCPGCAAERRRVR